MRPIDGDALAARIFNAMCADCLDECVACPWWDALNLIKKAKTVSANDIARFPTATGWISVKDRLPEKNGHYLVCTNDEEVYSAEYEKNRSNSEWADDYEGYIDMTVSHWMPLPEPPKE